jgi:hypothetical protein
MPPPYHSTSLPIHHRLPPYQRHTIQQQNRHRLRHTIQQQNRHRSQTQLPRQILRIYITERKNWEPSTFHLVHWPTIQTCMNSSTNHQKGHRLRTTYTSARQAMTADANAATGVKRATNSELHKRTPSHDRRCKRCNRHTKTYDHIRFGNTGMMTYTEQ